MQVPIAATRSDADFGWPAISSQLDRDGEEIGGMSAYRASGYANWALAIEKRFSNE